MKTNEGKDILYSGAIRKDNGEITYIEQVSYEYPYVRICWSDGTYTEAKCSDQDNFTREEGLRIALLKKFINNEQMENIYSDWLPAKNIPEKHPHIVTLSAVRAKHKRKKALQHQREKEKRIREAVNFLKLEGYVILK